jgi:hypothetical protein
MRYLLLIYEQEATAPPDPELIAKEMDAYAAFTAEVRARGLMQAGEALEPTSTATSVRVRDGETVVTDGPFAETKEVLTGFYQLDCKDLDEAIELAARIPASKRGAIEVRPIWELPPDYQETVQEKAREGATATSG